MIMCSCSLWCDGCGLLGAFVTGVSGWLLVWCACGIWALWLFSCCGC